MGAQNNRRKLEQDRRRYRRSLGLCYRCLEPAESGYEQCSYHREQDRERFQRARERKALARGFKYTRVPVTP